MGLCLECNSLAETVRKVKRSHIIPISRFPVQHIDCLLLGIYT